MSWNNLMYQYLGLILLKDTLDECIVHRDEQQLYEIEQEILSIKLGLLTNEILEVTSKAGKIKNEYIEILHDEANNNCNDDNDYYDEYKREPIEYDHDLYELWKRAVKLKQSVEMIYNSVNSGMSTRTVDPYKSSAPYGKGYCHNRKEVRKFRFDRVLNLKLTNNKFEKLKKS